MDKISISFYSIVSAIIFFNICMILILIFRHSLFFLVKYGEWCLLLLFIFSVIRILLPLDSVNAIVIHSNKVYPGILKMLHMPLITNQYSLGYILLIIWITGIIFMILKDCYLYFNEFRYIKKFLLVHDEQVDRISKESFSKNVEIFVTPNISVPKATGILKPYIYLPPLHVSDDEMRLIIKHEICHIRGGDIAIKILFSIFTDIFWWNPFMYIYQHEVDNLLELRCDHNITENMDQKEKANYLSTILHVIKQSKSYTDNYLTRSVMNFINYKTEDITKQRFQVIMRRKNYWRSEKHLVINSLVFVLFIASFFIIVQPAYYPERNEADHILEINTINSFILLSNNDYLLYINNEPYGYLSASELDTLPYSELEIIKEE